MDPTQSGAADALRMYNVIGGLIGALVVMAIIVGTLVLKGMALWRAARNGHKGWFIAMMILNVLGILEIVYLLGPGKAKDAPPTPPVAPQMPKP